MSIELKVKKILEIMGYDFMKDEYLLDFSISKNKNYILNQTNLTEIPEELTEIWVNMSVADFLQVKWSTNTLNIDTIDFTPMVNRIQEGDTTIDMTTSKDGGLTDEDRFLTILNIMRDNQISFSRFRRFKW